MKSSKIIIYLTLIVIILIIIVPTLIDVKEEENEHKMLVINNEIKYAATKCFREDKCLTDSIYLKDLYELDYLEKIINPITKEYINENTIITKVDNDILVNIP